MVGQWALFTRFGVRLVFSQTTLLALVSTCSFFKCVVMVSNQPCLLGVLSSSLHETEGRELKYKYLQLTINIFGPDVSSPARTRIWEYGDLEIPKLGITTII